jgi:hypothetical protein
MGTYEASFVGEGAVAPNQDIACNRLPEHFHPKNICDDLLCFL